GVADRTFRIEQRPIATAKRQRGRQWREPQNKSSNLGLEDHGAARPSRSSSRLPNKPNSSRLVQQSQRCPLTQTAKWFAPMTMTRREAQDQPCRPTQPWTPAPRDL